MSLTHRVGLQQDNQFKHWFMYFLIGFVVCTLRESPVQDEQTRTNHSPSDTRSFSYFLVTEINYLNKALELFNTAMGRLKFLLTGCQCHTTD